MNKLIPSLGDDNIKILNNEIQGYYSEKLDRIIEHNYRRKYFLLEISQNKIIHYSSNPYSMAQIWW